MEPGVVVEIRVRVLVDKVVQILVVIIVVLVVLAVAQE